MLRLILRMLWRDARAGELTLLGVALVLAVSALSSVGMLADRVQQGIVLQAHQLLGGDLLLSADHPWDDAYRQRIAASGLRLAESVSLMSMATRDEDAQLVDIKAVSEGFPLRGALRVAPALGAADAEVQRIPDAGQVWVDERLARSTGNQTLRIGAQSFQVGGVVTLDPDRGINAFAFAPRVTMRLADLAATQLLQAGSRATWRLHVAGESKAVEQFRLWAQARLERGERLESLDNARPEIRNILERSSRFMRLAALLAVVLAAVGIGLTTDRYVRRHLDGCAVMRCMGASSRRILAVFGGEFVAAGMVAVVIGTALGYAGQVVLLRLLDGLLGSDLPAPSWSSVGQGILVGVTLIIGFVMPPLLRIRRVSTTRVLRRDWSGVEPTSAIAYLIGVAALSGLMIWVAGDLTLGLVIVVGFTVAISIFAAFAYVLLTISRPRHAVTSSWGLALAGLRRRWRSTLLQAVALCLGLTALLLLGIARYDLLAAWQQRVPADAPNRFVINLQPAQQEAFADFFSARGLPVPVIEPMVRARLVAVNGLPRRAADYEDDRARRLVDREFNLSWSDRLPPGNDVSAGSWFGASREPQFSVEQGLADTLQLHLGDELGFEIAGVPLTARITSLRKLEWDSMRVNFFVLTPPGVLERHAASYITSFFLPHERESLIGELVAAFPNLTVIDVAAILRQVQDSVDQMVRAIQGLFAMALVAGVVVMVAALQASNDQRQHELALMRALGARRRQLRQILAFEFMLLGACAGGLAAVTAATIAWVLANQVFHFPYTPGLALPLLGVGLGAVAVMLVGLWATRRVFSRPPAQQLIAG